MPITFVSGDPTLTNAQYLAFGANAQGRTEVGALETALLSHYPSDAVRELLAGIDAVLLEFPDLPITWQLFGNGRITEMLDACGCVQTMIHEQ